jgi:uncharacterized membrane protein YkgB
VQRLIYAVVLFAVCLVFFWFTRPEWFRIDPVGVTPHVAVRAANPGLEL